MPAGAIEDSKQQTVGRRRYRDEPTKLLCDVPDMEQTTQVFHPSKRIKIAPTYLDDYYVNATMTISNQAMKSGTKTVKMPHSYNEAVVSPQSQKWLTGVKQ
ncbi:hypothetical protein CCR75_005885 [Bremia lactucae]|uniref:Uncharacterized protein n=1 Tax=Bremia lactucae TaxID=4779 RepID=A0A976IF29_BRELC|nr:hypothetical protein CCR75_005885 [Bremia lactucae]